MTFSPESGSLESLKATVEDFLGAHPDALWIEDGLCVSGLDGAQWRVSVEFGKVLLESWDTRRSILRRIEEIAYRDEGRLGLFVRKAGGRESLILELRADGAPPEQARAGLRAALRRDLTTYLRKHFPGWRVERVSNSSNREHSFSAWYTRGLVRRGQTAWAFLGMDPSEPLAAADAALAYGLHWLDWLRGRCEGCVVSGLKLFLPAEAIALTAMRASCLDPQALRVEICEWPCGDPPQPVIPGSFANVETRLAPRREAAAWIGRHHDLLREALGDLLSRLDCVPDSAANAVSFRVFGLEVARMEGQIAPKLTWGLEGNRRNLQNDELQGFRDFVRRVLAIRQASSRGAKEEVFRLQPERWLESLLVADLGKLDSTLRSDCAYSQVPAFSGMGRGVVDLLGISKEGRLAVIELKLHEAITLPLQALDYWLRVKLLNERGQFHKMGYFPGMAISPLPPLLYLASPAFRFHTTNERILRYFHPSVEVIQAGLNQQWREGVKVLFRRQIQPKL